MRLIQAHEGAELRERQVLQPKDSGQDESHERIIELIMRYLTAQQAPQAFNQVQMRAVSRQINQFKASLVLTSKGLNQASGMGRGIIQDDEPEDIRFGID